MTGVTLHSVTEEEVSRGLLWLNPARQQQATLVYRSSRNHPHSTKKSKLV